MSLSGNGRQSLNILLIEDNLDDEEIIKKELSRAGYKPNIKRIETEAGTQVALYSGDRWDLVLCDYLLPSFSALRALEMTREKLGDIPFIMLSGINDEEIALSMLKAGANDFINKDQLSRLPLAVKREIRASSDRMSSRLAIEKAYLLTIEAFGVALEKRDIHTNDHTIRVTDLTLRLAHSMGVAGSQFTSIRYGALLHDIGKIGIPDAVLLKRDPLDPSESAIMRLHPVIAYEMLSHIDFLKDAISIPYCHHEKYDGTGYPRGLDGDRIPFEARIFSVVDVYDALTNERPYRRPWSKEKAIEYIQSESGKSFDPAIVDRFIEVIK